MQNKLKNIVENPLFYRSILSLIIINAIVLGLQTYPEISSVYEPYLSYINNGILWLFAIEMVISIIAYRKKFFQDNWHVFDLVVITLAFLPLIEGSSSIFQAIRGVRILRLISAFPHLRRVTQGLANALPGIASIISILLIMLYIFSIIATRLFGAHHPEYFGNLQSSLFSLFQIMTLDGWQDIARSVAITHPYSWIFFICYILIATYTILNLFIAVIVDAMAKPLSKRIERNEKREMEIITRELAKIHRKIDRLKKD